MHRKTLINGALAGACLLYPVLIYFGLQHYSPRLIAMVVGSGIVLRLIGTERGQYTIRLLAPILGTLTLCLMSALSNHAVLLLYLPLLISVNLSLSFGYSLLYPPSMVEVFARRSKVELPPEAIRYCWSVTFVWVLFFALNSLLSGLTACCTTLETWSLYNGLLSYCGVGVLFGTELFYRYWRFRRYVGLPTDFLFKKVFPPRE